MQVGGRARHTDRYATGRTPTSSTSESKVPHAGNPWETGGEGKYSYYPGGDRTAEPKDAPSAVNVVVVPDVNLPKVRTYPHLEWFWRLHREAFRKLTWITGTAREVQQVGKGWLLDDCLKYLAGYGRRGGAQAEDHPLSASRERCVDRLASIGRQNYSQQNFPCLSRILG